MREKKLFLLYPMLLETKKEKKKKVKMVFGTNT